jgi:hypothetical protein
MLLSVARSYSNGIDVRAYDPTARYVDQGGNKRDLP